MPSSVLLLFLLLIAQPVYAEWVQIAESERADLLIDPSTIRWNDQNDKAKIWVLTDLKEARVGPDGTAYLSMKSQREFDCKEETSRDLSLTFLAEHMGAGKVVYTGYDDNDKWKPVVPDSLIHAVWKFVCTKK